MQILMRVPFWKKFTGKGHKHKNLNSVSSVIQKIFMRSF